MILWLLVPALLLTAPVQAAAYETSQNVTIYIENQSAVEGQTVSVSVQMELSESLASLSFFLYYNTSYLKLVSVEKGNIYPESASPSIVEREDLGRVAMGWFYSGIQEQEEAMLHGSGSCMELTFEALRDVDDAVLIRLQKISCSNFSCVRYQPSLYYGDVLMGDVDQDGRLGTLKDAFLTLQIVNGRTVADKQRLAADIFGKSEITRDTALRFLRYVNRKEQYLY